MEFKIKVRLTYNQIKELDLVLGEPDMTWEGDAPEGKQVYEFAYYGQYGTYHVRVNLKQELVTLLLVE